MLNMTLVWFTWPYRLNIFNEKKGYIYNMRLYNFVFYFVSRRLCVWSPIIPIVSTWYLHKYTHLLDCMLMNFWIAFLWNLHAAEWTKCVDRVKICYFTLSLFCNCINIIYYMVIKARNRDICFNKYQYKKVNMHNHWNKISFVLHRTCLSLFN